MPDTTNYMLLGYALGFLILALTIGSIWWRHRALAQDEATLSRLEQDDEQN